MTKMATKTFELGGIQDRREASHTRLVECIFGNDNALHLAGVLKKRYDSDFEIEELGENQGLRSYLLSSDRLKILVSNQEREVREARLTHSWDRGYMDLRINYRVLTGYVEGDFRNGEHIYIEGLIQESASQVRHEFPVCSDVESSRIDTR